MKRQIYLDYSATTPVDPRVAAKMMECLTLEGNFGNPASRSHGYGWWLERGACEQPGLRPDLPPVEELRIHRVGCAHPNACAQTGEWFHQPDRCAGQLGQVYRLAPGHHGIPSNA